MRWPGVKVKLPFVIPSHYPAPSPSLTALPPPTPPAALLKLGVMRTSVEVVAVHEGGVARPREVAAAAIGGEGSNDVLRILGRGAEERGVARRSSRCEVRLKGEVSHVPGGK
jgi:hypothetical protein